MSQISNEMAEFVQIANYGIGGQYGTHWDPVGDDLKDVPVRRVDGDRVATFMVYLSDVELAGKPYKNTLLHIISRFLRLWWNTHW